MTLGEEALTASADMGSSTIPWSRFTERWELDGYWMLFSAPNSSITLPMSDLPDEARPFIRRRIAGD